MSVISVISKIPLNSLGSLSGKKCWGHLIFFICEVNTKDLVIMSCVINWYIRGICLFVFVFVIFFFPFLLPYTWIWTCGKTLYKMDHQVPAHSLTVLHASIIQNRAFWLIFHYFFNRKKKEKKTYIWDMLLELHCYAYLMSVML